MVRPVTGFAPGGDRVAVSGAGTRSPEEPATDRGRPAPPHRVGEPGGGRAPASPLVAFPCSQPSRERRAVLALSLSLGRASSSVQSRRGPWGADNGRRQGQGRNSHRRPVCSGCETVSPSRHGPPGVGWGGAGHLSLLWPLDRRRERLPTRPGPGCSPGVRKHSRTDHRSHPGGPLPGRPSLVPRRKCARAGPTSFSFLWFTPIRFIQYPFG